MKGKTVTMIKDKREREKEKKFKQTESAAIGYSRVHAFGFQFISWFVRLLTMWWSDFCPHPVANKPRPNQRSVWRSRYNNKHPKNEDTSNEEGEQTSSPLTRNKCRPTGNRDLLAIYVFWCPTGCRVKNRTEIEKEGEGREGWRGRRR